MASGESVDSVARSTAIDDLAKRTPIALAWRDKEICPHVLECYETTSVDFPPDAIDNDEFDHFLANMGKLGVRRPAGEDIADDLAALAERGVLARQRRRLLREDIRDTADRILESIEQRPGVAKLRNAAVVELGHQDVIVS